MKLASYLHILGGVFNTGMAVGLLCGSQSVLPLVPWIILNFAMAAIYQGISQHNS